MSGRAKKWISAIFGVLVVLLGVAQMFRPLPVIAATPGALTQTTSIPTQPALDWASYGGQAVEVKGQSLSAFHGSDAPMSTASIAKLMTALGILHAQPFTLGSQGQTLTMTDADVALYNQEKAADQSVVEVQSGEQITEYQALQAILLPSACNMADSAAIWAFGSIQQYLDYANQEAATLGMTHTHFAADASGASPETVSTPQDLLKLAEAVSDQPVLMDIVGQNTANIPVVGTVYNYNGVLGQNGIIGLKTGNNDADPGAFLFAATYNSQIILGVTMGASSLNRALQDSVTLLKSVEDNVQQVPIVQAGQTVATYKAPWGASTPVVTSQGLSILGWKGTTLATQVHIQDLKNAGQANQTVGTINTTYNGKNLSVPVVLQKPLTGPSLVWRLMRIK